MRSLRARLFLAILGVVLLAVGASLALGIVLTRDAVRETIRSDVERQADALVGQTSLLGRRGNEAAPHAGVPLNAKGRRAPFPRPAWRRHRPGARRRRGRSR